MNNGKQPINPSMWTKCGDGADDYQPLKDNQKTGYETKFGGLTKREYFASKAMQGLLSNHAQIDSTNYEWVAKTAVGYADELLNELSKTTTPPNKGGDDETT